MKGISTPYSPFEPVNTTMDQPDLLEHAPVFQMKGSMVTLTTLELLEFNPSAFDLQLGERIAQAPSFFSESPIVLAIDKRQDLEAAFDLQAILNICKKHNLHVMALRAALPADVDSANSLGIPVLPPALTRDRPSSTATKPAPQTPERAAAKIIHTPVRSGQQIYAKGGDLIVLAAVSAGAELLADGHIHVYGPLRGRALAGINGDTQARIFCQQLGAEMVSIAGQYKIAEDLRRIPAWGSASQIYLDDQQMIIQTM